MYQGWLNERRFYGKFDFECGKTGFWATVGKFRANYKRRAHSLSFCHNCDNKKKQAG